MSPLRILLASSERGWYGGERQLRLLATGLRDRGHECALVARADGETSGRLGQEGFEILPLPGGGNSPAGWWSARRIIRRRAPDVIHANDPRALTGALMASVGLQVGARIASRRVSFPVRSPLAYRLLADRVICVSDAVRDRCESSGLAPDALRVVPDGVDCVALDAGRPVLPDEGLDLAPGAKLVLCVASLVPCKGHSVLLDALVRLANCDPPVVLAIVGAGPQESELLARAQALGLTRRVRFLGYREDVPDLLASADLFVMPSLEEGLGSALLEAACAGVPIVATNVGGIPEAVGPDGAEGLVQPGNSEALAEAILVKLANPESAARNAAAVRERARLRYSVEAMLDGTLAVYREILPVRRGPR